jgi:hypothetical protein
MEGVFTTDGKKKADYNGWKMEGRLQRADNGREVAAHDK